MLLPGLLATLLASALAAASPLETVEDNKACPCPNTCDRAAAKCQVKTKTQDLLAIYSSGTDFERADAFYLPNGGFTVIMEACTSEPGCCVNFYSPADAFTSFNGADAQYLPQSMEVKCDGQIVVKAILILPFAAPLFRSYAYDMTTVWVPSEDCDYKVISSVAVSMACEATETIPCSLCQAEMIA